MLRLKQGASALLGLKLDPDANGLPTDQLPDVPKWSVSDTSMASITVSDDGRNASIVGVSAGSLQVVVTSGDLTDVLDVTVVVPVVPGVTTGIHIVVISDGVATT